MIESPDDLKVQVEQVLSNEPNTRNSDKLLTWRIWQIFYGISDTIDKALFIGLPSEDNIKRIRAYYQNYLKQYIPTNWEVAKQRRWNERIWKELIGYYVEDPNQLKIF